MILVVAAVRHGTAWEIVGASVFGTSLILLYAVSCLYHAFQKPALKRLFQILDHGFIFVLIAGSYTPFVIGPLRGLTGWWLFGIVWAMAIGGFILKIVFAGKYEKPLSFLYLAMGWLIVFAASRILETMPAVGIWWLVAGGVAYSVGIVFFLMDRVKFAHAIWHLFVLGGSVAHFFAVLYGVVLIAR